ncbi:hypothetical protein SESBI_13724 [Sesbania bispinosa]|nr:hypothetical protein SESBI_13724 [Sesbania bispinosa]
MAAPESVHIPVTTKIIANGNDGETTGVEDLHGDWMLVTRNRRSPKSHPIKKETMMRGCKIPGTNLMGLKTITILTRFKEGAKP